MKYILSMLPVVIHLILWLKEKVIYELYVSTAFKEKDFMIHLELLAWSLNQKKKDFQKICFVSVSLIIYFSLN